MSNQCFFLAYRRKRGRLTIDWTHPTGGLVMDPERFVDGFPISDFRLAAEILKLRYHCQADEQLIVAEVLERREQRLAHKLHHRWEREMHSFLELMKCSA